MPRAMSRLAPILLALSCASTAWAAEPFPRAGAILAGFQADLDKAGEGYVLLLGDSNAAAVRPGMVGCPGPFVNLGIGGIRADQYLEIIRRARLPDGGAVAILNVGTGNLVRKLGPADPGAVAAYEASVEGIVRAVAPHVRRVVVNAIPPLGGRGAVKLDPGMVEAYSLRSKAVCARLGCAYADPWASVRGASFGIERPGASHDGLHPADVAGAYGTLSALACGPGGRSASR